MPLAATEWLESEGDNHAERAYFVKWFDYHGLRTQPS
jgi:hypothetical protein